MAETMTTENTVKTHPAEGAVDLTQGVKLYAPKGAKFHTEGEETTVAEGLVATFETLGYSKKAPAKK